MLVVAWEIKQKLIKPRTKLNTIYNNTAITNIPGMSKLSCYSSRDLLVQFASAKLVANYARAAKVHTVTKKKMPIMPGPYLNKVT